MSDDVIIGRIMALDVGSVRTGVAFSDERGIIASPYDVIQATQKKDWLSKIKGVIRDEDPARILVGVPLNQDGEEGKDANTIGEYIALLRENTSLPVIEWDERFTTVQAERTLIAADVSRKNRKQVIDKLAAAILLQSYLDSLHFQEIKPWEENPDYTNVWET